MLEWKLHREIEWEWSGSGYYLKNTQEFKLFDNRTVLLHFTSSLTLNMFCLNDFLMASQQNFKWLS